MLSSFYRTVIFQKYENSLCSHGEFKDVFVVLVQSPNSHLFNFDETTENLRSQRFCVFHYHDPTSEIQTSALLSFIEQFVIALTIT